MKILSNKLGELEINEDSIIFFKEGILGFENLKKFVIVEHKVGSLLKWLVPIDDSSISFIIIRPEQFKYDYSLNISDDDIKFLDIKSEEDVLIYSIVVVPQDPKKMTANLQGPIVINALNKKAKQIISTNAKHKLKHFILEEMQINSSKLKESMKVKNKNEDFFVNTPNMNQGGK
jgi:flagellar assembly factor FliW